MDVLKNKASDLICSVLTPLSKLVGEFLKYIYVILFTSLICISVTSSGCYSNKKREMCEIRITLDDNSFMRFERTLELLFFTFLWLTNFFKKLFGYFKVYVI